MKWTQGSISTDYRSPVIASICIAIAARSVDKALLADHKATSIALFILSDTGRVKEGKVFLFIPSVFHKASIGVRGNQFAVCHADEEVFS